jgi:hypothetical protein
MSDQPEKKPRGRQPGWRKPNAMPSRIPAMRIPAQLEEWLLIEAEKRGLKIVDMARMLLLEAMRGDDGKNRPRR